MEAKTAKQKCRLVEGVVVRKWEYSRFVGGRVGERGTEAGPRNIIQ